MRADPRIEAALPEWIQAAHGAKGAIVERLAAELGVSPQSVYRRLARLLAGARKRKQRSDAGRTSMSEGEVIALASIVEETRRETGTGALPLEDALDVARANGLVRAERLDPRTGECKPLSVTTARRAMRKHYVARAQLELETPAARLSSPHPNYLWQVDASISSQYYLAGDGLHAMPKGEFYDGKPHNFARIEKQRLWRYVVTDHASGCFEVFYVLGAESAANLTASLIHAMSYRPDGTMHGVPKLLMADPGSATKASPTRNLCDALGIEVIINQVGNARAKGQVEQAHYLVETHFEARLALQAPVRTLEEINTQAQAWSAGFNATRTHTRTGVSRRDGWMRITPEQLIAAPAIGAMRQLTNSTPKTCTVRDYLIQFRGSTYDLRGIPELLNGDRVEVVVNALDPEGSVRVLRPGAGESYTHYLAPRVERDAFGFLATAAQVGVEFKSPPQSPAEAAARELERTAMEVRTDEEAKAARKAKRVPFGGRIDPLKDVAQLRIPPAIPRASTPSSVEIPNVVDLSVPRPVWEEPKREFALYSHYEAMRTIRPLLAARGLEWSTAMVEDTVARWPEGMPYDQVEAWAETLWSRYRLQVVRAATDGAA